MNPENIIKPTMREVFDTVSSMELKDKPEGQTLSIPIKNGPGQPFLGYEKYTNQLSWWQRIINWIKSIFKRVNKSNQ